MRKIGILQRVVLATALSLLAVACGGVPADMEIERARVALNTATQAGAPDSSPDEYASAEAALAEAEKLNEEGEYDAARERAAEAERLAEEATLAAEAAEEESLFDEEGPSEEEAAQQAERERQEAEARAARETAARAAAAAAQARAAEEAQRRAQEEAARRASTAGRTTGTAGGHSVSPGDNLWRIAGRADVYNDSRLWPLIYWANQDAIRDPDVLVMGRSLTIPRNFSEGERVRALEFSRDRPDFAPEHIGDGQ